MSSATSASREAEFNTRPLDLKGLDGSKHPASLGASRTCRRPKFRFQTRFETRTGVACRPRRPHQVGCGPHHKAWKEARALLERQLIPERAVSLRRGETVQPRKEHEDQVRRLRDWTALRSLRGSAFIQSKNSPGRRGRQAKNPYWQILRIRGCSLAVPHAPHRRSQTEDVHLYGLLLGL